MPESFQEIDPVIVRMAQAIAVSQSRSDWQSFVATARASLAVLREPSDGMLEAASAGMPDWGELADEWRAMIDYVLSESVQVNDNRSVSQEKKIAG